MSDCVQITVFEDGPMEVKNCDTARYAGESIAVDGPLYLCRCGESANAPFCDGSHKPAGFDGSCPSPPEQEVRTWEGRTLRTFFNKATCMHVFYCKPLKALREQELAGDASAAAEIMRVVDTCPSGALSYEAKDPALSAPDRAPPAVAIDIIDGGEVRVQVPFEINAERHAGQPEDRATLCRCGMSKNKPWCDGRHKGRKGFR